MVEIPLLLASVAVVLLQAFFPVLVGQSERVNVPVMLGGLWQRKRSTPEVEQSRAGWYHAFEEVGIEVKLPACIAGILGPGLGIP